MAFNRPSASFARIGDIPVSIDSVISLSCSPRACFTNSIQLGKADGSGILSAENPFGRNGVRSSLSWARFRDAIDCQSEGLESIFGEKQRYRYNDKSVEQINDGSFA